jgi:hypothetical protein
MHLPLDDHGRSMDDRPVSSYGREGEIVPDFRSDLPNPEKNKKIKKIYINDLSLS